MLHVQTIGFALVVAVVVSALAAGSASAETELDQWLLVHTQSGVHLDTKAAGAVVDSLAAGVPSIGGGKESETRE